MLFQHFLCFNTFQGRGDSYNVSIQTVFWDIIYPKVLNTYNIGVMILGGWSGGVILYAHLLLKVQNSFIGAICIPP